MLRRLFLYLVRYLSDLEKYTAYSSVSSSSSSTLRVFWIRKIHFSHIHSYCSFPNILIVSEIIFIHRYDSHASPYFIIIPFSILCDVSRFSVFYGFLYSAHFIPFNIHFSGGYFVFVPPTLFNVLKHMLFSLFVLLSLSFIFNTILAIICNIPTVILHFLHAVWRTIFIFR